jgi:protein kinase-like protein/TIR domain-containing protein
VGQHITMRSARFVDPHRLRLDPVARSRSSTSLPVDPLKLDPVFSESIPPGPESSRYTWPNLSAADDLDWRPYPVHLRDSWEKRPLPRVFICHSTADRLLLAREIVPLLNAHRIDTWFASEDVRTAEEWESSIRKGLELCEWFLIALSPRALASSWVRTEVHWAADRRQGHIVPVMLEACDPGVLHLRLTQIQYVDFTAPSDRARQRLLAVWQVPYSPQPKPDLPRGRQIREAIASLRGYRSFKTLGRGSTCTVYSADSDRYGSVAIKVLDSDLDPAFVAAALKAVRDMATIDHPSVLPIFAVDELDGMVFIVMRCAPGPTLAQIIRNEPMTPWKTAEIVAAIAEGLAAAHANGIVHHDLKPGNIFLDRDGRPLIADFGLKPPDSGYVVGSLSYVSPEAVTGEQAHASSDVFSVGMIFYELLTGGHRPFPSVTPTEYIRAVLHTEPAPPHTIAADVPTDLERICLKCLAKRPEERYSAAELAQALRAYLMSSRV